MSRHKHRNRERPLVTARKTENLRDRQSVTRRSWHSDERRQFDPLPPSKLELPDDLVQDYRETYTLVDGRPAEVVQRMPRNANNVHLRESHLSEAVHDYFQESPKLVSECERRARRRRVLFALSRTRKGSGRGKKHRWTELSKVRCV